MIFFFYLQQARTAVPAAFNASALQARTYADKASPTEVSSILEQRIRGVQEEAGLAETGRVLSVGYVSYLSIRQSDVDFSIQFDPISFA